MENGIEGVIVGFDCHEESHVASALDPIGRVQATGVFAASPTGYAQIHEWLGSIGPVLAIGVESSGSYGAGLARSLNRAGLSVIEVNRPHRHLRARRGKNDAIDAEAAARKVLSGEAAGSAKNSAGLVEAIRQLSVARDGAVKARTAALGQFGGLWVTAPANLRERLSRRKTLAGRAAACVRTRIPAGAATNPERAAKLALRSIARRIAGLDEEIRSLDEQLTELVKLAAPRTAQQLGLGTHTTAALLVAAGRISTASTRRPPSLTSVGSPRCLSPRGRPSVTD